MKYKTKDWHHRRPQSLNGTKEPRNMSYVPKNKHRAWHLLFSNHTPEMIAEIINSVWLDPSYEFIVRRKPS